MIKLLFIILTTTSPATYSAQSAERVAMRLAGEGAISVSYESGHPETYEYAVCTVKNRLRNGWDISTVLNPYYAPSVSVDDMFVLRAYLILNDLTSFDCLDVYYLYSLQDIHYLGIQEEQIKLKFISQTRQNFGLALVEK